MRARSWCAPSPRATAPLPPSCMTAERSRRGAAYGRDQRVVGHDEPGHAHAAALVLRHSPEIRRHALELHAVIVTTMPWTPDPNALRGRVAVVAGATRGAGRGIAAALGKAGATVVCTGRSTRGRRSEYDRAETIEETAAQRRRRLTARHLALHRRGPRARRG